jgi:hypothetical protein
LRSSQNKSWINVQQQLLAKLQFLNFGDETGDGGANVGNATRTDGPLLALGQSSSQVTALQVGSANHDDVIGQSVVSRHTTHQLFQQDLPWLFRSNDESKSKSKK